MGSILGNSFRPGSLLLNLSKRGMQGMRGGVSVPGFRRARVAGGGMRTALNIPGSGISFIKVFRRVFRRLVKALFRR